MNINFGDGNSGFQAGTVHGSVNAAFHHYPAPERPETPPTPSILIPFGRDSDFVERGEVLEKIEHSCSRPGSRTALVGLGGVGKSQLAIEYAYRTQDRCSDTWVFWIHASNSARFEQGFRDIATYLKLPGRQNPKVNIFQLVHDWLQDRGKGPWLIILDNVDDAGFLTVPSTNGKAAATTMKSTVARQLRSYIPHCQHGFVLITSRSKGAALELVEDANIIAIEPMNERDALCLFHKKLGHSADEACINELAVALEYMPLAIVQAAAYVVQRRPRCSVRKYLDEFRNSDKRKATLLGLKSGGLRRDAEAKNSILISWQISFDYIRENRPSAADLLSLMSFCDRQGIPESLLRSQIDDISSNNSEQKHPDTEYHMGAEIGLNDSAGEVESNDSGNDSDSDATERQSNYSENDSFEDDITTLRNFSFITANEDGVTFGMHRLVQLAILKWLKAQHIYGRWRHQLLVRLRAEFPGAEYENWSKCQALFPHALSVSAQRPSTDDSIKEWATILYKAAWYAREKGNGIEAEALSMQALKAIKKIFNEDHEDVIWAKAMVASAYNLRGLWSEAEKLEVQVMEMSRAKLGPDHPETLTSMANLASTYRHQGRWEEAEKLGVQVMETRRAKLGPNHPSTLTSMTNLASTYRNQGRWEDAEKLEVQVMEPRRAKLGPDHPDALTSMANLAATYRHQGRWDEAEKLEVQVMEMSKAKLGVDHPSTLTSMANLAATYWNQGRWEEAEKLEVQVMETRRAKLGPDHPDTLTSMANLASTYWNQGRWEEAEKLQVQVMEAFKAKLGPDHPDTLTGMNNLASTYRDQGRWEEAEKLQVQVMETRKAKLGPGHPDTLTSMNNLAHTWKNMGKRSAATDLMLECVRLRKLKLGLNHLYTQSSIFYLDKWMSGNNAETHENA